jgi:hypothetical protein
MKGGDGAEPHPGRRADHPGEYDEHGRVDQARLDQSPDRLAVRQRIAELAGQQAGEPDPVLVGQATIQVQLPFECAQPGWIGGPAEHGQRGIAWQYLGGQENHDRYDEQRQHADSQAAHHQVRDRMPGQQRITRWAPAHLRARDRHSVRLACISALFQHRCSRGNLNGRYYRAKRRRR